MLNIVKFTKNFLVMETAGFEGFFRILFFIFIFYYVFKFVAKLLFPILIKKVVQKAGQSFQQQQQQQQNYNTPQKDEVVVDTSNAKTSKTNKTVGEYIDYEEIK